MSTLLLRLAGPLQSWGIDCKFETRRTENYPTKSGVIGMVAAAMGYSREQSLEELNSLKFGIRVDHQGELLCDYHVAMAKNPYVTRRYYLSDATFLVGLESDNMEFLQTIENALKNPKYPLFLGRRSCPPTFPLICGIRHKDLLNSLKDENWLLEDWRKKIIFNDYDKELRIIIDTDDLSDISPVKDVPISFSPIHRKFSWRNVKDIGYICKSNEEKPTEHDPMKELR